MVRELLRNDLRSAINSTSTEPPYVLANQVDKFCFSADLNLSIVAYVFVGVR